jgi:competence protein ComEC
MTTRFRAYQLDSPGSLFSFYKAGSFTLIEARIPKGGIEVLEKELGICGAIKMNHLHITSWDDDHCDYDSLVNILNTFRPDRIDIPSYMPTSESGKLCRRVLLGYDRIHQIYIPNTFTINEEYINGLTKGEAGGTSDIIYPSKFNVSNKNDMSLIRFFRSSGFSVLSLGDCESSDISSSITFDGSFLNTETDALILAHHGSDNSCITGEFLDKICPKVAICSSNYNNEYGHPEQNVKSLLSSRNIPLYTTKTGDIIIQQLAGENTATIFNLIGDNTEINSTKQFFPKRFAGLANHFSDLRKMA